MTGEAMRMRSETYYYYKCPNTRLKSPTACRAPRVRAVEAEQAVWAAIGRVRLPPALLVALVAQHAGVTGHMEAELERARRRLARLRELFLWGDIGEAEYAASRDLVQGWIRALEERRPGSPAGGTASAAVEQPEYVRKVVRALIDYVQPVGSVILDDEIRWHDEVVPYLPSNLSGPSKVRRSDMGGLTERQQEVLRTYYARGSYRSTAEQLGVSVNTVRNSLTASRRKLGVNHSHRAALFVTPLSPQVAAGRSRRNRG
jgi:DNA-binding CsgD family transcriptional regulator